TLSSFMRAPLLFEDQTAYPLCKFTECCRVYFSVGWISKGHRTILDRVHNHKMTIIAAKASNEGTVFGQRSELLRAGVCIESLPPGGEPIHVLRESGWRQSLVPTVSQVRAIDFYAFEFSQELRSAGRTTRILGELADHRCTRTAQIVGRPRR